MDETAAQMIAKLTVPALHRSLWKIEDATSRRAVTQQVYELQKNTWKSLPNYNSTMARHLVQDVHPMFRKGFDRVVQKSSEEKVDIQGFIRVNDSLHGHHGIEDSYWFPNLRRAHPEIIEELDILESEHKRLVQLEKDICAGQLAALQEFVGLLNDHLNREEMLTVPFLMDGTGGL